MPANVTPCKRLSTLTSAQLASSWMATSNCVDIEIGQRASVHLHFYSWRVEGPAMPDIEINASLTRMLDTNGKVVGNLPDFARDQTELLRLYRTLVLTRTLDTKAIALQRTGRLGTYASSLGQEAVAVGAAAAMRKDDALLPSFREHGGQLWRGVTPKELLLYWGGDERGNNFAGPRGDFPNCATVGSHLAHAVGVALAFRLRGEKRAAVCVFGDGATSKGDFAEALNMAGVWKVPAVFVINNNGWGISVPVAKQTAAATLAQKAAANRNAGRR